MDAAPLLPILEPGPGLVDVILPEVGDHHLHAGLDQLLGDAQADARGAAGDQGDLAFQVLHEVLRYQSKNATQRMSMLSRGGASSPALGSSKAVCGTRRKRVGSEA